MQHENKNTEQPNHAAQQQTGGPQQDARDERDEKIKNEPDTARLRSERQSVIDGGSEQSRQE